MPDMNQDAEDEIWIGGNGGVKLLTSPFETVMSSADAAAYTTPEYQSLTLISDQNADLIPDVIANGNQGRAVLILSPFSGELSPSVELKAPTANEQVKGLHVDDFTGSGDPYFALLSESEDAVYLDANIGQSSIDFVNSPSSVLYWTNNLTAGQVLSFGDMTGDGIHDILVAIPETGAGAVRMIEGGNIASTAMLDLEGWEGELSGGQAGQALIDAGDWNGDGLSDVWIGAPNAGTQNAGRVYLGSVDRLGSLSQSEIILEGTSSGESFGQSIAQGDSDGDGLPEIAVCSPDWLTKGRCAAFTQLSNGVFDPSDAQFTFEGSSQNLHLGQEVAFTNSDFDSLWATSPLGSETGHQQGLIFRLQGLGY